MPNFTLPYGAQSLNFGIAENFVSDLILPGHFVPLANPEEIVALAIDHPLDFSWDRFKSAQSVAIAINDKTRPVPHELILPALMKQLERIGIPPNKIHFWIATGTHLPMSEEEFPRLMPQQLVNRYTISSHNVDNQSELIHVGKTSYQTDVWVNRHFYESDLKIVVGNIEPHHFAGFSGGMKTAAIGLCGRETINHNHAMLGHPDAWIGKYEDNPLRQDIEEIGKLIHVHLAVNVVLNQNHQIADAFAGEPVAVMKKGIPRARIICGVQGFKNYDLVIASAGGQPKDINFYQAQKALTHASLFARSGATIFLVAACPEGIGSAAYEDLMQTLDSVDEIFAYFRSNPFQVGPHKALQVARILQRNPVMLVSNIPDKHVKRMLLQPAQDLQCSVDNAVAILAPNSKVAILPHATTTLPV